MSLYTYIYIVTLVDLQIFLIRLLTEMLRDNSSKRQNHTILHTNLLRKKKLEGQIGLFKLSLQGGRVGESFQLEILSYSFEDDNIQASSSDQG